jgi:hypothetical protein
MLATCVLSNSAELQLSAENQTEFASLFRDLVKERKFILSKDVSCTKEGYTAIDCTTYKLCTTISGTLLGVIAKCYPYNFNPVDLKCDPNYVCPPCTTVGHVCLKNNSAFRLCGDGGTVLIIEEVCPTNYFCNVKCTNPCTKSVPEC